MNKSLGEILVIPRQIIQISGHCSTGKTQLVLFSTVWYLLNHPQSRVVFIDTGNAFCITRLTTFLSESDCFKDFDQSQINLHSILSRIDVVKCFSIHEFQKRILLEPTFQSLMHYEHGILFIIDSIGSLLSPIVGSNHYQVNEILDQLEFTFQEWIAHFNNTILITNYATTYGNEIRPALGSRWNSIPTIKWNTSIPQEEEARQKRLTCCFTKRSEDEEILSYETSQGKLFVAFKRRLTRLTSPTSVIEFCIGGSELFII